MTLKRALPSESDVSAHEHVPAMQIVAIAQEEASDEMQEETSVNMHAATSPARLSEQRSQESPSGSESDSDDSDSEESIVAKNVPSGLKNEERDEIRFPFVENPRNEAFPCPTARQMKWMDACSKCLRVEKSPPAPMKSNEGFTFAFVFPSIGTAIPNEALEVVNLFLRILKTFETDMEGFVVPTPYLGLMYNSPVLGRSKSAPRCIGITQKLKSVFAGTRAPDAPFNIRDVFEQCASANSDMSQDVLVSPIRIHIGFTGCIFQEGEDDDCEKRKESFCMVFINFPNNVNLIGYMEQFFVLPNIGTSFKETKYQEIQENRQTFMNLLLFQCDLLKMPDARTDPQQWSRNYFGIFGLVSVCNVFMIPLKILATIHAEHPGAKNVKIIGFPELCFDANDTIRHYTSYMSLFLQKWKEHHELLEDNIKKYLSLSAAEKDDFTAPLPSAGGWPIQSSKRTDGRIIFTGFSSVPPIPIIMKFDAPANVVTSTTSGLRANGGAMCPRLVDFLLRRFFGDLADEDQNKMEEDSFLTDRREITDMERHKKYYGSNADPLDAMARNNYMSLWWLAFLKALRMRRENNSISIFRACIAINNHIETALRKHHGDTDLHMSERISQVANWMKNHSNSPLANIKVNPFFTEIVNGERVPEVCRTDHSSRLKFFFLFMISDLNRNTKLNAVNLKIFVELLNSAILWFMGDRDSTPSGFFACMQIMGGAGHFYVLSQKDNTIRYTIKNNSTGADFIKNQVNMLLATLGNYYATSVDDNMQLFLTLNKWTPESLVIQTSVDIVGGVVVGLPDRKLKDRSFVCTEMRGNSTPFGPLITWGIPRDIGPKVSITTQDPQQTNKRVVSGKHQISFVNFCMLCTNTMPQDQQQNEEVKTLGAVTHCVVPGAEAYKPIKQNSSQLNDIHCEEFTGRAGKLKDGPRTDILVKCLGWSHMVSAHYGALFQRSGAIPNEIPDVVSAFLDWMTFYLKHWCSCIFGKGIAADISRLVTGYTARHVSLSGWLSTIAEVVEDRPVDEVIFRMNKRMLLCCFDDVSFQLCVAYVSIPDFSFLQVIGCMHTFLSRSIDHSLVHIASVCIKLFNVPILTPTELRVFCSDDEVSI